MTKTAVVLGATGVAGRSLVTEMEKAGDWKIYGVSRRKPNYETTAHYVSADLMDADSCRSALGALTDATHIFWAAYSDAPTFAETREPNARMFRNAVEAIEAKAKGLEHVCLLQGTKYYGQYLGPFKTPAKETDSRIATPHYYYDQEDFLLGLQKGKSWTWSAPRPHVICGYALGNPLNIVSVIAVYATMLRELGLPFFWPGKPGAYTSVYQATDAGLLGRAMIWMATEKACGNQAFNITNGDYFRYQNLWPRFADYFGLPLGDPKQTDLKAFMADKESLWLKIVDKYGLERHPFNMVADWRFANYAFSNDWDVMSNTTKCRRFGFLEFIDSEEMFIQLFDDLKSRNIIPSK